MQQLSGIFVALLAGSLMPLLIWVGAVSAMRQGRKKMLSGKGCALDADCPPGFTCQGGYCMPQQ